MKKVILKVLSYIGYTIAGLAWWTAAIVITLAVTGTLLDILGVG